MSFSYYTDNELKNKKIEKLVDSIEENLDTFHNTFYFPINDYQEGDSLFVIKLWKGRGYVLDIFLVFGNNLEEAIEILGNFLIQEGLTNYLINVEKEIKYIMKDEGLDYEEAEDKFYDWFDFIDFGNREFYLQGEGFNYKEYPI